MTDQTDRIHTSILVVAWAAIVVTFAVIFVFKLDFDRFCLWFFIGCSVLEAYGAYFLRERHRWAFAAAMFLVGAGFVAKDFWGFEFNGVFDGLVILAFGLALFFQVRYWLGNFQQSKDKPE